MNAAAALPVVGVDLAKSAFQIGRALADPHSAVPTLIRQTMKLLDGQQAVEGMVRPCPGGGFASASASKSRRQPGATGRARAARDKLSLVANAGRAAQ
ncbi:MAG: hypothetical protein ABW318_12945 [Vicinamibacterales bacterium]|jgi:hypothetical protein